MLTPQTFGPRQIRLLVSTKLDLFRRIESVSFTVLVKALLQFESCKYTTFLFILQRDLKIRLSVFTCNHYTHNTRFLNPLSVQNLLVLVSLLSYNVEPWCRLTKQLNKSFCFYLHPMVVCYFQLKLLLCIVSWCVYSDLHWFRRKQEPCPYYSLDGNKYTWWQHSKWTDCFALHWTNALTGQEPHILFPSV